MDLYNKKNLVYLRTQKGLSQEQLANILGYSRNTYKHFEYDTDHDAEFLFKVSQYFGVNIHDLITKDLVAMDNDILKDQIKELSLSSGLRVLTITVNDKQKENIEFVPIKAKAGYLSGHSDPEFIVKLKRFNLPLPANGTFRAFEIEGDSMPPHKKGSVIIGRFLEKLDDIKNGKTYVVVTKDDGIVYKRLFRKQAKPDELIFLSDNKAYDPYTKNIADIIEIWEYYAHLSFDPNENLVFVMDEKLVAKIEELGDKMKK